MDWNHTWQKCSLQGPYQVLLLFVPTVLRSRWLLLLKIEMSSIVHCCFDISQNELKFNCSYMARNSLTYIPGNSMKFFFQPIYTDYANYAYFDKRSHLNFLLRNCWTKINQTWQGWSLGGSLSKLCPTARPPFKMAAVTKNRNFFNCPLLL
jgi:hypothetical protein